MDLEEVACDEKTMCKSQALSSHINSELRALGIVLILAGKELIFFTLASMELCFGFVLKIELVTQGFFIIAEQSLHRSFFLPLFPPHH